MTSPTPLPTQPRHLVAAAVTSPTPAPARCRFGTCEAPAELHMALSGADGVVYIDRPVCLRHATLEVDVLLYDTPGGHALTLRALQ